MPIVAEGDEEPNDTFRGQLIASAEAAVQVPPPPPPFSGTVRPAGAERNAFNDYSSCCHEPIGTRRIV